MRASTRFSYGPAANLDQLDWTLLSLLQENARMPISRLAQRMGVSRDVAKYRLKKLFSEKTVLCFLVMPNLPKLGYSVWGYVHLRFTNLSKAREQAFIRYVQAHPNVLFAHSTLGSWDFGIEFAARDPGHLFDLQRELMEKFSDIIKDVQTGSFVDVYKTAYVPPKL